MQGIRIIATCLCVDGSEITDHFLPTRPLQRDGSLPRSTIAERGHVGIAGNDVNMIP